MPSSVKGTALSLYFLKGAPVNSNFKRCLLSPSIFVPLIFFSLKRIPLSSKLYFLFNSSAFSSISSLEASYPPFSAYWICFDSFKSLGPLTLLGFDSLSSKASINIFLSVIDIFPLVAFFKFSLIALTVASRLITFPSGNVAK